MTIRLEQFDFRLLSFPCFIIYDLISTFIFLHILRTFFIIIPVDLPTRSLANFSLSLCLFLTHTLCFYLTLRMIKIYYESSTSLRYVYFPFIYMHIYTYIDRYTNIYMYLYTYIDFYI